MPMTPIRVAFPGSQGADLAARLDLPLGRPRGFALFAHCFTCSKDILAAKSIAAELAKENIAVMRFDFTGLGHSGGEFANSNFTSNIDDLRRAAHFLNENYGGPDILIGHSLGGAAALAVAGELPFVKAVVTIGAPAEPDHVIHNFGGALGAIETDGQADVKLGGRSFTIQKQFVDDVRSMNLATKVAALKKPLLVMHSPIDDIVGIANATQIFAAAKHPKSFVSLESADHLLTDKRDASFAARVIAGWGQRHLAPQSEPAAEPEEGAASVRVGETGGGKFQQAVRVGRHTMLADEPVSFGGDDTGPSPYDYLSIALGACTSMTLRMYADRKKIPLEHVETEVLHEKIHFDDCAECDDHLAGKKIDRFERRITLVGDLDDATRQRLLEIADKCPVHRTLEAESVIATRLVG